MAAKHKQKNKTKGKNMKLKVSEMSFSSADKEEDDPGEGELSGEDGEDEPGPERKEKNAKSDEFNLEEVLKLGGTQSDFVMLSAVDEWNELIDGGKKGAIDDLEEGELEKFISKLGIRAYSSLQTVPDEEEAPAEKQEPEEKKPEAVSSKANSKASSKVNGEESTSAEGKKTAVKTKDLKKTAVKKNVFEFTQRTLLLIKPGGKWFHNDYSSEVCSGAQDGELVSRYEALALQLLQQEQDLYRSKKNLQRGANSSWMKNVVSAGVLADRLAAMTVLIQDSPVHSLEHLSSLVAMMRRKGGRRMGLMAVDTLRELLLSDLLPENRKLHPFKLRPFEDLEQRASGNREARDRRLLLWMFEHKLKIIMEDFVSALEVVSHDTVLTTKAKALTTAFELLSARPEQEKALLTQMVNKLGDPEYKLAAKASHTLETLLHRHPNMKGVVCAEVERLLFRANVGEKAQYYALCFLSQVILTRDDGALAGRLIGIYFSFFRWCVKRQEVAGRMLSALLSGVNRAYPYATEGDAAVRKHMDTLFSVVHSVRFNTAVQALMLLFQVMESQQAVSDRYYCALYRKLLDPGLVSSSRQSMFLNLVYKSVKADTVLRRVKAFLKRLLQVSAENSASFTCGALFLLSEILRSKPGLQTLLQDNQDGEESFRDQPDEEEEENFVDADKATPPPQDKPSASWVHHHNMEGGVRSHSYDPLHRNPLFCGADHCTLWELHQLAAHYHPSVSLFAKTILKGESVSYSGDPLQDFTLIRFLDRFVFRNPKQQKQSSESIVLQPKKTATSSAPVNCDEFVTKDESQIPVDQVFFHRYFRKRQQQQQEQQQGRRPRPDADTESIEDVDDDEFEKILDSCEGDSFYVQLKEDNLDFAGNVSRKKTSDPLDSDPDSDQDSDLDLDDEEVELSLDEEDFGEEFEEEGGAFMNPDDNDEDVPELEDDFEDSQEEQEEQEQEETRQKTTCKRKNSEKLDFTDSKGAKKKKRMKSNTGAFVSAEEFGSLLDENAGSKVDHTGLDAVRNSDKAGVKQLKWESQRDDWIHNRDVKTLRKKKAMFQKRRKPGDRKRTPGDRKRTPGAAMLGGKSPGNKKFSGKRRK
ncbi:unnamed protein product [Knipowitschia caucasica]|uniref:CCAAT/enhancer-binding protein zeta n=1 Tax=Knipowitschia caucasica TaxID=637954 RepID=A0AAV2K7G3_KNICA